MFDTNIFNHILDGDIDITDLADRASFCVTHIQRDELNNTKDVERRARLVRVFEAPIQNHVPTESFVLDTSRLGEAKLGGENILSTASAVYGVSKYGRAKYTAEDNLYTPIKSRFDQVNRNKPDSVQDASIAETAIKNNHTLITQDSDLNKVATEFGGACANFA